LAADRCMVTGMLEKPGDCKPLEIEASAHEILGEAKVD